MRLGWVELLLGPAFLLAGACAGTPERGPDEEGAVSAVTEGRASRGSTPLPCDVARVLTVSCQGCHARDPGRSAPMALVTREDLLAPAISQPGKRVVDVMRARIHERDPERAMPPKTSRRLTEDELTVLDTFIAGGAPAGASPCDFEVSSDTPPSEETLPDLGTCYRVGVHELAHSGDSTPYRAPHGDYESCFYADIPWPAGSQALAIRSRQSPLVHHWELYHTTERRPDGDLTREVASCDAALREVIAIFARGQQAVQTMPDGVGLVLPDAGPGHGLLLDVHFFNDGDPIDDSTAVEICTAAAPRPNAATVSALISPQFALPPGQASEVEGRCSPPGRDEIHVFRTFPHMHARGVRMQLEIERADGARDSVLDVGFDFGHQISYETPALLDPGDRVLTTCHFINDTGATIYNGPRTSDEMCVNFVYAWPAGALSDGFLEGLSTPCLY